MSTTALVGGGSGVARPGAVSLAHGGVLFLDHAPEFSPGHLDMLRAALETGEVLLARHDGTVRYPARFRLLVGADSCPCRAPQLAGCRCTPAVLRRYRAHLTGALFDRVDLAVTLDAAASAAGQATGQPAGTAVEEETATVRARVRAARAVSRQRWPQAGSRANADLPGPVLSRTPAPTREAIEVLQRALRAGRLTIRGCERAARVAWTIADLAGAERPDVAAVEEALAFGRVELDPS